MNDSDLQALENAVTHSIVIAIQTESEEPGSPIYAVQPPSTIIRAAAVAAAQVLMAFERGYRMESAPEELTLPAGFKPITNNTTRTEGGQ